MIYPNLPALRTVLLFTSLCIATPGLTQSVPDKNVCPLPAQTETQPERDPLDKKTYISADEAKVETDKTTAFKGKVSIIRGTRQLDADSTTYNHATDDLHAQGNVEITDKNFTIQGNTALLNLETEQGEISATRYHTGRKGAHGTADKIIIHSKDRYTLDNATYTTCPADKDGDLDWNFTASTLKIDNETRQGQATNAVLRFKGVPMFYFPYLRFPLGEERLSGFLYPTFGVSDEHGTEIAVPYYWNIAPNLDATFTPHSLSRRGVKLDTEFRYLTEGSNGIVSYDILPDDSVFGDDREKFSWLHTGVAGHGWTTNINYNYVSDDEYLNDFSSNLASSSLTHLERSGQLTYNATHWQLSTLVQGYQTLDGSEPYKRLPQILFTSRFGHLQNELNYDISGELVNFDHADSNMITGQRLKLVPTVSYPLQSDAAFFVPKLSLHHVAYNLQTDADPSFSEHPNATIPVFSMDSGLFFERDTSLGGTRLLHTLEPRLFYLYAPQRDQSNLPNFDSGLTTFSPTFLFLENRFTGNDRVGDANQITAALTTRLYRQDTGSELFNASLGQIYFLRDRTVNLTNTAAQTETHSSTVGTLNFSPVKSFNFNNEIQWDSTSNHTEVLNSRIQYLPGNGSVINLDYRFRRNDLRTRNFSAAWRINQAWQIFAGNNYDLQNDHRLEDFAGFQYDSCCWGLRLAWRSRFDSNDVNGQPIFENGIFLEIEFKGLSSFGQRKDLDTMLNNGILGYSPR